MEKTHSVVATLLIRLSFVLSFCSRQNEMVVLPLGAGKTSENCIGLCLVRGSDRQQPPQQQHHNHHHHHHELRPLWSQQHLNLPYLFALDILLCSLVQPICDIERSPISFSLHSLIFAEQKNCEFM